MMSSSDKAVVICFILLAIIVLVGPLVAYDQGQKDIIKACEHTSFFYSGDKTFECLPYHKGMLEHETIPDLKAPR